VVEIIGGFRLQPNGPRPPLSATVDSPAPPSLAASVLKPAERIERRALGVEAGNAAVLPHHQSPVDPIYDRLGDAQRNLAPATAPRAH
jgi:hypothetical protein